jgi:hypothetical protein
MTMDKNEIKKYVEQNPSLIGMRETSYPGLYVLKYKKRVFYDDLWNRFTEECRGTIVDEHFNVISRPFTKIYNYGIESRAPRISLDTVVRAYRKVNGFMVAMTMYGDELLVSTTGSTDSDYVRMAKEQMMAQHPWSHWVDCAKMVSGHTLMFECVHTKDPHIIPETPGMYFLGWRKNDWDSKIDGYGFGNGDWQGYTENCLRCSFPEMTETTLQDLISESKIVRHEGFVAYTADGRSFKIKSPYYLVNKFVARNPRTEKLMRSDIKKSIDEEFWPLIDHIQQHIQEFTAMHEQDRLKWVQDFLEKS